MNNQHKEYKKQVRMFLDAPSQTWTEKIELIADYIMQQVNNNK